MSLPVESILPALRSALREGRSAVLVAAPGAGKTTTVPLALLGEDWAKTGKLLLLSPRRVAARAAADRMASLLGERVGETVGFRVRFESRVSAATRIEIVTEGVFTRMILADPSLEGIVAVIFDEFHERSLEGDLGLALALDVRGALRDDLRLLVMSATLDAARVAAMLGDAPILQSEGRLHPVRVEHLGRDPRQKIEESMAQTVASAVAREPGDLLCFLPGAGEIERTRERLADRLAGRGEIDVLTLYGALDPRRQDEAIRPSAPGRRKIVLATSIAETSLTIEGVRVVIDSGLSRRPRYEPGVGLTRLETVRASRASVEQRMGRAGRTAPGVCLRLWDEGETRALAPFDRPEILEADLAGLALDLAAWGVTDPMSLSWLDPPPRAAWSEAQALLQEIGALDGDGRLTASGHEIAGMPLHPRLARMVLAARAEDRDGLAARIAILIGEQGLGGRDVDIRERLRRWRNEQGQRARAAMAAARRIASGGGADEEAGLVLALAYPERIAKARGQRGEFLMANGRIVAVGEDDALARAQFLAVAEASGRAERAQVLLAAPLTAEEVETLFASAIRAEDRIDFDPATLGVRARRIRRLGRITLAEAPLDRPDPQSRAAVLLGAVRREGLGLLPWPEAAVQFRARVAMMRRLEGDAWPDLGEAALRDNLEDWLGPALERVARLSELADGALEEGLHSLLDWRLRVALDQQAPARFETPAGSALLIDYAAENGPALDVRLQELFGMTIHPAVASGRAPLLLRLLSPAHRPVQTTRDLPGFWSGSYAAVRSEMKGRYPRHPWPDDPAAAPPTRRAKPRGS